MSRRLLLVIGLSAFVVLVALLVYPERRRSLIKEIARVTSGGERSSSQGGAGGEDRPGAHLWPDMPTMTLAEATKKIDSNDVFERRQAVWVLQDVGPSNEEAVEPLSRHVDDSDESVSFYSIQALGRIRSPKGVKALVGALQSDNKIKSIYAARALANFGPEASEAVPTLVTMVKGDLITAQSAARALKSIGGPEAKEVLDRPRTKVLMMVEQGYY